MEKNNIEIFRLEKIIEHCDTLIKDVGNLSLEEFIKNDLLFRASAFSLTNTCEQVSRLRKKYENIFTEVPWKNINAMRNLIVHEYWEIDYELVYDAIKNDIPILREKIARILDET